MQDKNSIVSIDIYLQDKPVKRVSPNGDLLKLTKGNSETTYNQGISPKFHKDDKIKVDFDRRETEKPNKNGTGWVPDYENSGDGIKNIKYIDPIEYEQELLESGIPLSKTVSEILKNIA